MPPWPLLVLGGAALAFLFVPPLVGWPGVVRVSAVLVPLWAAVLWWKRSWFRHPPEERAAAATPRVPRAVWAAAAATGVILFWIVLTRFQSGEVNAVDFTVYFDRPLFQTSQGKPLYVETTDDPRFENLSHLAVHAYWILLPLALLYKLHATPLWLLALAVVAIVAGAIHLWRIGGLLGWPRLLSGATALAYVLNDNTARTLNYGFHPEVLYAWFVPWLLDAGLRGAQLSFITAVVACVLVKEDAIFPLFAGSVALGFVRWRQLSHRDRILFLVLPTALALANLGFYYRYVVPAIAPSGEVMYAYFWENYGPSPVLALRAMITSPWRLVQDTWNSGLVSVVMPPHLFLQALGWQWSVGTLPLAMLYGASAGEQVRAFGIYYAIPLVPFHTLGASAGALLLLRMLPRNLATPALAGAVLVLGALVIGNGYSVRPWKAELAAVPEALRTLGAEETILVQSGLYPHAGYDARVKLLTPHALRDPANEGVVLLLAPRISAYPFSRHELKDMLRHKRIAPLPKGLRAVRLKGRHMR